MSYLRLAANASALSTIVPKAAATLARAHPGLELSLIDQHPVEALQMLRNGEIDVALIYRHVDDPAEDQGFRLLHIGDDPISCFARSRSRHDRLPGPPRHWTTL